MKERYAMEIILLYIEMYFGDSIWKPCIITTLLFLTVALFVYKCLSKKEFPKYIIFSFVILLGLLALFVYNLFFLGSKSVLIISLGVTILVTLPVLCKYINLELKLRKIMRRSDFYNKSFDIIEAWKSLGELTERDMIPRQRKSYYRYKIFLLIEMGCISEAEIITGELKDKKLKKKDDVEVLLLEFNSYYDRGEMSQAKEVIKKIKPLTSRKSESQRYIKVLINMGIAYKSAGMILEADQYFKEALEILKKKGIKDRDIRKTLYENYIFNKLQIEQDSWKDILEEYREGLNLSDPYSLLDYTNLKIHLLRQTEASKKDLDEFIKKSFKNLMKLKITEEQKMILSVSMFQIAHDEGIDPREYLQKLKDHQDRLDELKMPDRYEMMKKIEYIMRKLAPEIQDYFKVIHEKSIKYMSNDAENDLKKYLDSLPVEAVHQRAYCYRELAGLYSRLEVNYNFDRVEAYLGAAIDLYKENKLNLNAYRKMMHIVDQLCGIQHLDSAYKPKQRNKIENYLKKVEVFISGASKHQTLAEFYLRLGFYNLLMDDYEKAMQYYKEFENTGVAIKHFSPEFQGYYNRLVSDRRVILFYQAIEEIKQEENIIFPDEKTRLWFTNFPYNDGLLVSMLLARNLGAKSQIVFKRKTWQEHRGEEINPREHYWLWIPEVGINIDLTYTQFGKDKYKNSIFFIRDGHPLESGESYAMQKKILKGSIVAFKTTELVADEDDLSDNDKLLYKFVAELILSRVGETVHV